MADPNIGRLTAAMQHARLSLRRFRENRFRMVREYVGSNYSEEGTQHTVPLNLLSLYEQIVCKSLVAQNPRVMLSTTLMQHKPVVSAMQAWANRAIKKMNLAETLERWVQNAFFSIGICKVGIATPGDAAGSGWQQEAGSPFAEVVDLDDFVFDVHARRFDHSSFIGHRYRMPKEVAIKMFRSKAKGLTVSEDPYFNEQGDERVSLLQRSFYGGSEEFEDMVDLWEVYLPRYRMVVTLADEDVTTGGATSLKQALHHQPWIGPDCGPYYPLSLGGTVPNNAIAKSPMQDVLDLHLAVNNIYRKLIRQAQRQKEVLPVTGAGVEAGNRVLETNDGEAVQTDHEMKPISFGGPNANNAAMGTHLNTLFSRQAGNLDMAGGLSPQSKTLGQDQMLAQNASSAIARLRETTTLGTAKLISGLCWFWHHHPTNVMTSPHSAPGMPAATIERSVTPKQRQAVRFEDLDIEIAPYSLQSQTPQARLQTLMQVVDKLMPMMQLLQQQGIAIDINVLLKKIGEYADAPDLTELFTMRQAPAQPGAASPEAPGGAKPANTSREYIRRSVGQNTDANNEADFVNQMTSGAASNGKLEGAPA